MGTIRQMTAPLRALVRFPLFQLAIVVVVILLLQAADQATLAGRLFTSLDRLVEATVSLFAATFNVRSFTRSWLTSGFWIAYVYLALLLILSLLRLASGALVDLAARTNALWLRNTIARERGIAAYRAWVPLEKIRPAHIPQAAWEEQFAWPADNSAPYRPLAQRLVISGAVNVVVIALVLVALQLFTPFPVLIWLRGLLFG